MLARGSRELTVHTGHHRRRAEAVLSSPLDGVGFTVSMAFGEGGLSEPEASSADRTGTGIIASENGLNLAVRNHTKQRQVRADV
jgi:hypothetical protein